MMSRGRAGRRRTHRQLTLLAGSLFRARQLTAERIVDERAMMSRGRAGRRRTHRQLTLLAGSLFRARQLTAERIVDELTLLAGSLFRARKLTAERIEVELAIRAVLSLGRRSGVVVGRLSSIGGHTEISCSQCEKYKEGNFGHHHCFLKMWKSNAS